MINIKSPSVKKTVREYYSYMGENHTKVIGIIKNKYSDYDMLLVRFSDSNGQEMSSLLDYQEWADGHIDVTEVFTAFRIDEESMVNDFEESKEYKMEVVE